jgi:hypothetical protein
MARHNCTTAFEFARYTTDYFCDVKCNLQDSRRSYQTVSSFRLNNKQKNHEEFILDSVVGDDSGEN